MSGIFYGVGVGPGDPDLLTLKAIKTIEKADVIIAPITEKNKESLALSIVRSYICDHVNIVWQVFPMTNNMNEQTEAWHNNKTEIIGYLEKGKQVAFLTLGDPMMYSTYIYVYNLLKDSGFTIKTIPGITSFCDIASKTGFPLVEGKEILTVVPATNDSEFLEQTLDTGDNLVLMKVYKNFDDVMKKLKKSGHLKRAVMVSNSGMPDEEIYYNLDEIKNKKLKYLTTIIARREKN